MEHGNRNDEGQIEPVRNEDVRFLALHQRHQENEKIGHPDNRQPKVGVPFGFGVFLGLGYSEKIASAGYDYKEVIAKNDKPWRKVAGEAYPRSLLDDVERSRDQHIAAEGEDHRRRVQGPEPAKAGPGQIKIQPGPCELGCDYQSDRETRNPPEHRHHRGEFYRTKIVVWATLDSLKCWRRRTLEIPVNNGKNGHHARNPAERGMEGKRGIQSLGRCDQAKKC